MAIFRIRFVLISLIWLFTGIGCLRYSPPLYSLSPPSPTPEGKHLTLMLQPITTQGVGSEERKRLGLNISAYFTAFEATIRNETGAAVDFDATQSVLTVDGKGDLRALNEEESVQQYRMGPQRVFFVFPKSAARKEREVARIREMRMKSGPVAPGAEAHGFLFFPKLSEEACTTLRLRVGGIRVKGEPHEMAFQFTCRAPSAE